MTTNESNEKSKAFGKGKPIVHENLNKKKALLVSAFKGGSAVKAIAEEHLEELELLTTTAGIETIGKITCHTRKYEASTFLTEGKLEEVRLLRESLGADVIIFDDEITPAQQRNLEKIIKVYVMDRTELILDVFAQRAQTKEAQLQIELAKIRYDAPRLKRLWTHLSRQTATSGGGAYTKGEGEKQIELDRRILKRKIEKLQEEIDEVKAHRDTQRSSRSRSEIPTFAIIGYTNAGKSTLLNALTAAGVFVEDKLFATLDTTTRKFTLKNNQEILLIDTVGFIRKLPHQLVAAFKSTLEEAVQADILLHLIDINHPMAEEQAMTTYEVLEELGATEKPIITVMNKVDVAQNDEMLTKIRVKYPHNISISALTGHGLDDLQEVMIQELSRQRKHIDLRIPQSDYAAVSEIMRLGHILNQDFVDNDVLLRADLPVALVGKYKKYHVTEEIMESKKKEDWE